MLKFLQNNVIVNKLLNIPEYGYLSFLDKYPRIQNGLCNLMLNSLGIPVLFLILVFVFNSVEYAIYLISTFL